MITFLHRIYFWLIVFIDIDECFPSPCLHGECADGVNSYSCSCDAGYEGTNCDISTVDVPFFCLFCVYLFVLLLFCFAQTEKVLDQ